MNTKSIHETLAALGAGMMIAGCATSPADPGGAEVKPVAEVPATSPPPATTTAAKKHGAQMSCGEGSCG